MPQGERNGDSLNTLFKKVLSYILRYVFDYYCDTNRQDVDDNKMWDIYSWRPLILRMRRDIDDLKM